MDSIYITIEITIVFLVVQGLNYKCTENSDFFVVRICFGRVRSNQFAGLINTFPFSPDCFILIYFFFFHFISVVSCATNMHLHKLQCVDHTGKDLGL